MSANAAAVIVTEPQPSPFDVLAVAVDSWAAMSHAAGEYTPEQHAALAAALFAGLVPIVGEVSGPDARITFYTQPQTFNAAE